MELPKLFKQTKESLKQESFRLNYLQRDLNEKRKFILEHIKEYKEIKSRLIEQQKEEEYLIKYFDYLDSLQEKR